MANNPHEESEMFVCVLTQGELEALADGKTITFDYDGDVIESYMQVAVEAEDTTTDNMDVELGEHGRGVRRFALVRHEDNTGTSGEGVVAVGVEYPDGAVHMQWQNDINEELDTESNGVAFKPAPDGVEATREIHGHGGNTEVVFF